MRVVADAVYLLKPAVSSNHLLKRMVAFEKKIQLLRDSQKSDGEGESQVLTYAMKKAG